MRPSLVIDVVLDAVLRTALVFSFFLLFTGHNAPGGGFVGGLVAGATLVLRDLVAGRRRTVRLVLSDPNRVLAWGLALTIATGAGGWLWGGDFLESAHLSVTLPLLGTLEATTALPFDIGVYLVVVGLVLAVLRTLGTEQ